MEQQHQSQQLKETEQEGWLSAAGRSGAPEADCRKNNVAQAA